MKKHLSVSILFLSVLLLGTDSLLPKTNTSRDFAVTTVRQAVQTEKQSTSKTVEQLIEADQPELTKRFDDLKAINEDSIAYVYAPGTQLDEPVVHTGDNHTYLQYTIDGQYDPFMGTVFMDMDNSPDFSDRLTWLFGHARGSAVPDHRMFNDVNFYDDQTYFDEHPYVVIETPQRKFYYEAAFLTIVPETTAFYRTAFEDDEDFHQQLIGVHQDAQTKKADLVLDPKDRYLVLSTCREEDVTIRSNLYLRQISDQELPKFLEEHGDDLIYQATRSVSE